MSRRQASGDEVSRVDGESAVAVVTGAAAPRGIGLACACRLLERGWRVVAVDVSDLDSTAIERLSRAARSCDEDDNLEGFVCLRGDVANESDCDRVVRLALERYSRVDGLANVAGITDPTPLLDAEPGRIEQIFRVNVLGTILLSRAIAPLMAEHGGGSIVNVSSVSAPAGGGIFGAAPYAASKGAVEALTRAIAREWADGGIRCNAVAPGFIDTDITKGKLTEDQRRGIEERSLLGRAGTASEVAQVVSFLLSESSSYMTGAIVDVNGGLYFRT